MARRMWKSHGAMPADVLWRDACGSAIARRLRKSSDGRLRMRCGATPAEALWRDACGSAMTRRLQWRYGATPAEAL